MTSLTEWVIIVLSKDEAQLNARFAFIRAALEKQLVLPQNTVMN